MSASPSWSDERVDTLRTLWRDGLSASQIANELGGVTRNAVIGKVHRLGLSGRGAPSAPSRARCTPEPRATRLTRAARPAPASAIARAAPSPSSAPEGPGLVDNLVHLSAHLCKWPIGDPKAAGFSFCGRVSDGRYCAAHERQGVRPGTAWRADRDFIVKRALSGLV